MDGPLNGVRVLDLTRVLAGPFATMLLADLGADVIKVERPGDGDETRHLPPLREGESHYFMSVNRGKRGIAIDLKQPAGRDLALELAGASDVLVENFRPGVIARLGLDYERVRGVNPALVYCSISAFGQSGPLSDRAAFDVAMQALGGIMSVTGQPEGPPLRSGLPMADLGTGLFAAIGILSALVEQRRTGRGQLVDVAMFDAMAGLLTQYAGRYFMTGESAHRVGNGHPAVAPYGSYPAADGDIVIANLGERFWPKIARAIDRPELADDPRFATNADRLRHREELDALIAVQTRRRPVAEWQARFEAGDVPHAPVQDVAQVLEHPQAHARGLVTEVEHALLGLMRTTGRPITLPAHPEMRQTAAPLLGQHTDEVLRDLLGATAEQLAAWRAAGVIHSSLPLEGGGLARG
ncbi:MAG TPA: CoA transferase [Candidatus Dormibacteraeota bacterium]|nr:CoA transferase [Candidatus Dormibacteraeota bacterium]